MGDYTHNIISMHAQKYNPEVPTTQQERDEQPTSKIHLLTDQLLNLKQMVLKPVSKLKIYTNQINVYDIIIVYICEEDFAHLFNLFFLIFFSLCRFFSSIYSILPYLDNPFVKIRL